MPTRHGASLAKNAKTSLRLSFRATTTLPSPSTPWTWNTFFARSSPMLVIVVMDGSSLVIGAADKTECLAGCKSPYRQLPVFGRLAYLERAEATKHDRPRRRSPSYPAAVLAAVGTIRGASKLGGRNITEYLQPRNRGLREVVIRRTDAGSRPVNHLGKADDTVEETGESTRCTAGVGDPASKERFSEITSGSCRGQQGTGNNLQGLSNETKNRRRREPNGSGA